MARNANSDVNDDHDHDDHDDLHGHSDSPFNQYNVDVVRFDAINSTMLANGDLIRGDVIDKTKKIEQQDDDDDDEEQEEDQLLALEFGLFGPNYELVKHLIPTDSINNKSFTDVTFIVGPPQHSKKYVGHRVLLAMTSPVFETLFYGDMADKSKYIRIVDVAPIGFENLLRYAYTDSLNLNSVEDAMLTAYAAKKYLLPQLLRECLTYIEHNIGPSSACVVFEFAHVLNSQQLVLQAMNLIDRQTMNVITNKSFNHVQWSTVEFVANRKYLNLTSEFALFQSVLNWSLAEAKRRQLQPGQWSSVRAIMREGSILGALRFLAMSQEEFARAVASTSSTFGANLDPGGQNNGNPMMDQSAGETDTGKPAVSNNKQQPPADQLAKVNTDDPNSLLNDTEQRAVFLNLALGDVAKLPATINPSRDTRQPPPEYFTLRRFRGSSSSSSTGGGGGGGGSNLIVTTTTTRGIKSICSKFQALSENVFIVGLTIPIRLDASSYSNRTPKFECHLKFTTRASSQSPPPPPLASGAPGQQQPPVGATSTGAAADGQHHGQQQQQQQQQQADATLLMDTIDESLHISIAKDRDCLVRLKRPILIRMGNINELTLTFQTYALDEDIVALRTPKLRSANFSELTDGENISWLFFKTPGVEFSELHYYY